LTLPNPATGTTSSITATQLLVAAGLTGTFTKVEVSRIDAWAVGSSNASGTSGTIAQAVRIRTFVPTTAAGTTFTADREFEDIGVENAVGAHIPVRYHGSLQSYSTGAAAPVVVEVLPTFSQGLVVLDFMCTFYATSVTTSLLEVQRIIASSIHPAFSANESWADEVDDYMETMSTTMSGLALDIEGA
jgi:hypothetical protein